MSSSHPDFDPSGTADPHEASGEGASTPDSPHPTSRQDEVDAVLGDADADLAAESAAEPESVDKAVSRMQREVELAHQRVLLAQAELENFRKRTRKDYEDQLRFAALPMVEDLLQVRDNLARALEAAEASSATIEGLRDGVGMVAKQLDGILNKHGIHPIPAVGESFDPNFHQAIAQAPSAEHQPGIVAIEAATGFQMHGRVVRPSQVVVSTGKP